MAGVDHFTTSADESMPTMTITAAARELQRPGEVIRIARLICVDEDQVEGAATLGGEPSQGVQRFSQTEFD